MNTLKRLLGHSKTIGSYIGYLLVMSGFIYRRRRKRKIMIVIRKNYMHKHIDTSIMLPLFARSGPRCAPREKPDPQYRASVKQKAYLNR